MLTEQLLSAKQYFWLGTHPVGLVVKNLPANAGGARDASLILGSGRFLGEGNGKPLQYSCLGNPMDRGAWQVMVHGVAKSQTQLSDQHCSEQNRQNPALKGVTFQWRRQKESGKYTDSSMCRELHLWSSGSLNSPSGQVQVQSLVRELDPICSN